MDRPKGSKNKNPHILQQFCLNGHDTFITGRYGRGAYIKCMADRRELHPEEHRIQMEKWRKENRGRVREIQRKAGWKMQGIINSDGSPFTEMDRNSAFEVQHGKCAICGILENQLNTILHVDHAHNTGFFRGLLCSNCNHFLAILENKDFCINAAKYLDKKRSK